ncbi:MAG: hypothetical protein ABSF00_04745 [Candidatus Bathyarchaeia archaeon]
MSRRKLPVILALAVSIIVLVSSLVPSTAATAGQWRLLSPTEYTPSPTSQLNSIFMLNGGTSGKGSGNGWAVGQNGAIFYWDGFSWNQAGPTSSCTYNSVNFGGPLNPVSNGVQTSSGWTVGQCSGTTATSLYWNGVGWQSYSVPASGTSVANSVFLVQSSSSTTGTVIAIAVGNDASGGAIWTWNGVPGQGAGWVELSPAPTPNHLNSVYMTSSYLSTCTAPGVQGVAVGDSGTILTDCGTWTAVATPVPSTPLYGVAMSSPTSGWAVGGSCTILSTTPAGPTTWATYSPTPCLDPSVTLRSIVMLSSSEAWAVGDSDANGNPTILHGTSLDSTPQWTQIPVNQVTPKGLASSVGLNSITFAPTGGNLWAVGASGVAAFCQSNCSSMSGSLWSTTTSPLTGTTTPYQLNSVFMDSDSDGWAVGQANPSGAPAILQWNGYSWTQAASVSPLVTAPLYGVSMSGSSNAWAVGGASATPSTIYFNGNVWSGVAAPSCTCILQSVFMISGSETWAVGTNGVIMHTTTTGGTFSSTTSPVPAVAALDTVFFADSQNGWAAGTCTAVTANCLAVGDPIIIHTATDGGDNWGTIFTAGSGLPTPSGTSYTITSLFFQDNSHGWASASSGLAHPTLILFWNGVSWTQVSAITTNPDDDLYGISVEGGTPATDGWAAGQDSVTHLPVTIHYDGTSWTEMSLSPAIPNQGVLLALYLRSSTNGLAVGPGFGSDTLSLILHLDPPGSFQNTVVQQVTVTNVVTTSATSTTSSTSVTSQSTSTTASTSSTSTSSTSPPTTIVSTTVATVTLGSTPTSTTTQVTSSVSTPLALPPMPGFPLESILAGILVGMAALTILRRRRK